MGDKKRLLWWGDSATAATGFGTVSRNVLSAIAATGEWEITQRGVNGYGQRHLYPWTIHPAGYPDGDPFGKKAFIRDLLSAPPFDLVIINNDTYVVNEMAGEIRRILESGHPARVIFYYPIDCKLPPSMTDMIRTATQAVAYSRFGAAETRKVVPDVTPVIIPHGCETVPKLTTQERRDLRAQAFGITSDDTFLWMNVNRNSVRKDIARSIEAFASFHLYQPDSALYVHCQPQDNGLDMAAAAAEAGVTGKVAFPGDFSLSSGGMPRDMLMRCYQLADGFITTHLGEGWGLSVTEAMACGLPVVAPSNTTMPEILGADYPWLYDCKETIWVDNSAYRQRGTVRDIFGAMKRLYIAKTGRTAEYSAMMDRSSKFVQAVSWENVGGMWLTLIDHVMQQPTLRQSTTVDTI